MGRRAFTLIELLIVMVVISILAAVMAGALSRAGTSAKIVSTRSQVHKLHNQVTYRWESYRTRRLPIDPRPVAVAELVAAGEPVADAQAKIYLGLETPPTPANPNPPSWPNAPYLAGVRLRAIRELMRLEMPQRWDDITSDTAAYPGPAITPDILDTTPTLSLAYLRRYNGQASRPTANFQGAECLYMIVTMGVEDNSLGTNQLSLKDVGDVDGDGMREFIDGFGNPISFLRWAPGFESDLQPDADPVAPGIQRDPSGRHDPFDVMKLDTSATAPYRGFQLFPLIYSAGPDGAQDIWAMNISMTAVELNDPYYSPAAPAMQPGTPMTPTSSEPGEGRHTDNIHNHLLGPG